MAHRPQVRAKAEQYFAIYCQLGVARSLKAVREALADMSVSVSHATMERYSKDYEWVRRAAEFDTAVTVRVQERQEERAADGVVLMNTRQAALGRALQGKAAQGLQTLQQDLLGAGDVAAMARDGVKIERLAMGEATSRQELAVLVINPVIQEIVALFVRVNDLADPELRKREFAVGADAIIAGHLQAVPT